MLLTGSRVVPVSSGEVWRALTDPAVLQASIAGCEAFTPLDADRYEVIVRAAVGPIRARFKGTARLIEREPGRRFELTGAGEGGAAGFGKMTARIVLESQGAETTVLYEVESHVGGKLAQLGSRLIQSIAAKFAADFFERFSGLLVNAEVHR